MDCQGHWLHSRGDILAVDKIDFTASEALSAEELGGAAHIAHNCLVDGTKALVSRPGVITWNPGATMTADSDPIIGLVDYNGFLVGVKKSRSIFAISKEGQVLQLSNSDQTTKLDGGGRPAFVKGRQRLVIVGGGQMQMWSGTGLSSRFPVLMPSQPPPTANGACAIAQSLVISRPDNSGQIWWSGGLEDYDDWDLATSNAGYLQAAANPDRILTIAANTNEVFAFGAETLQTFTPTASVIDTSGTSSLFMPGRATEIGTAAAASVIRVDDSFFLLDSNKRIIQTDARQYDDRSKAIISELRGFSRVDDCWGFRLRHGQFDALVFVFPTQNRAFVAELETGRWSEWTKFSADSDVIDITSAHFWPDVGMMVGRADGTVGIMTDGTAGDSGDEIRLRSATGFIDRGSLNMKWCKSVALTFKHKPLTTASGKARISSRDDLGAWHLRGEIDLGGTMQNTWILRSLGTYRYRQWMVEYTGTNQFALISAQEDFDILGV